jgi:hypothetical protein
MFKTKYRSNGIGMEKRSVANLSKRVFLCQEIKLSDKFDDIEIRFDRESTDRSQDSANINININTNIDDDAESMSQGELRVINFDDG